jgi:peptidoglycan/xylan/chitin deacetylase (PgdA/CDA1 family)
MYHDVVNAHDPDGSGFPGAAAATYKVDTDLFERHLEAIERRAGAPAAQALFPEPAGTPASDGWLLTFDDGGASAITQVADRLEARRWRGTFFVTTDRVGTPGFLTAAQVRELATRGHVIGSHSRSHPRRMSACARGDVRSEWRESVAVLAEMTGVPVVHASVPNGEFNRMVGEEASAAGIRVLFTSNPTRSRFLLDGCLVVGRYNVRATSSPDWVAAVAAGDRGTLYAQWMGWKLKGIAKGIARNRYQWLRERWMSGSSES